MLAGAAPLLGIKQNILLGCFNTSDELKNGKNLGAIAFQNESLLPMDAAIGDELDGRLYTDLSQVSGEESVIPTDNFFLRTRASEFLAAQFPWYVKFGGLVKQPVSLTSDRLAAMAKPMGLHLMECAGNASDGHFGLIGVADWQGVLLVGLLEGLNLEPEARRVLVSGFDHYSRRSRSSVPGASWVFTLEQLTACKAFLATAMNGQPLRKDHGAPVRLVMPGWYGCSCIKWVNEIALVADDVYATSQMQEYASRTLQQDVLQFARDYRPAVIDQAAMPRRIEKWLVDGKIEYRVMGIMWGGSRPVNILEIQFNPSEPFIPVDGFQQQHNDPWSFWSYAWKPAKPGTYRIQLRVKDPVVPARKMDAGFYTRSVEIAEI